MTGSMTATAMATATATAAAAAAPRAGAGAAAAPERYAFFDLDGTLISQASVIAFYRHYVEAEFPDRAARLWQEFHAAVTHMRAAGVPRDEINAWYYRQHLAQADVARLRVLAADWVDERWRDPAFVRHHVLEHARSHRAARVGTVLVTGSFRELVQPLAARLGIDAYLCAPLEERDGRYTGALTAPPTIGCGKWLAIEHFLREHGVAAHHCFGYGDDHSDIPFLERLGEPRVVAEATSELKAHAHSHGWRVLQD